MPRTILITGGSGKGKSSSLRNLPKESTFILNWEKKALPFKGQAEFIQYRPLKVDDGMNCLKLLPHKERDALTNGKIMEIIVLDSFSSFSEDLMNEALNIRTGYEVFRYYNAKIYELFQDIKKLNTVGKHIIVIGHDETLSTEDAGTIKRLKVNGKQWEGMVEKEFDVVLYADALINSERKIDYIFRTQTDGVISAKSPMDMLNNPEINDMNIIINKINEYDK